MSVSAGAATTMDERMRVTERPAETPVMVQMWRDLGFLHWPVDAEAVGRVLPPGLEVDTYDGLAYVGIVPFTIPTTRAMGAVPMVPPFHEINLRTYVHRGGRDPGAAKATAPVGSYWARNSAGGTPERWVRYWTLGPHPSTASGGSTTCMSMRAWKYGSA